MIQCLTPPETTFSLTSSPYLSQRADIFQCHLLYHLKPPSRPPSHCLSGYLTGFNTFLCQVQPGPLTRSFPLQPSQRHFCFLSSPTSGHLMCKGAIVATPSHGCVRPSFSSSPLPHGGCSVAMHLYLFRIREHMTVTMCHAITSWTLYYPFCFRRLTPSWHSGFASRVQPGIRCQSRRFLRLPLHHHPSDLPPSSKSLV